MMILMVPQVILISPCLFDRVVEYWENGNLKNVEHYEMKIQKSSESPDSSVSF